VARSSETKKPPLWAAIPTKAAQNSVRAIGSA
jgi:hypothetical protein